MRLSIIAAICCSFFFLSNIPLVFAAEQYPEGKIVFYNASNKTITAQVSALGKINLAAKEEKSIAYSALSQVCSAHPRSCTAQFYINDSPAGAATINVETGKLVSMNLSMKVHTSKGSNQVLRSVVIQ